MEDFLQGVATAYWWLILLVSLIIGVIGNFLSAGIRKLFGSISSRQRERNLERDREINEEVVYLLNHPEEIIDFRFEATRYDISATRNLFLTFVIFLIGMPREGAPYIFTIAAMIFALFPYYFFIRAINKRNHYTIVAMKARKRLREDNKEEIKEKHNETPKR